MSDARSGSAVSAEGGVLKQDLVKVQLGGFGQAALIKNREFFLGGMSREPLRLEWFQFLLLGQGEGEGLRSRE